MQSRNKHKHKIQIYKETRQNEEIKQQYGKEPGGKRKMGMLNDCKDKRSYVELKWKGRH